MNESVDIFGYFDAPGQERPAFDPGRGVPCPICLHALADKPVRCTSLMLVGDDRSYFFRAHKQCWDDAGQEEQERIEHALIDAGAARLRQQAEEMEEDRLTELQRLGQEIEK